MEKYSVYITNKAHTSLRNIVKHKVAYSKNIATAKKFAIGFYQQANTLSTLPYRGFDISKDNKAQVYQGYLIVYHIQKPDKVHILDIIDPRQDTVASKYY